MTVFQKMKKTSCLKPEKRIDEKPWDLEQVCIFYQ